MSIFALDLEDGLVRYGPIPGEDTLHNSGRLIRIVHILKSLKQQKLISGDDQSSAMMNDGRFELPSTDEQLKLVRMGLRAAKENHNIEAYKTIWGLCGGQIEGEIFDQNFSNSEIMEEKFERITTSLDQEKLTRIASNMRPVLEELVQFQHQIGDHNAAVQTLSENRRAWNRDGESDIQYCQLLVVSSLMAAASSGSSDPLRIFTSSTWIRSEAHLAAGLYYLMKGEFEEALLSFQKMTPIESGPITAIIHPKDAALYTALAAMAVLPKRSQTKSSSSETTPEIIDYLSISRDVLLNLRNCEYISVMDFFKQARPRLLLDPYLTPICASIFRAVKRRAVTEFCSAFTEVTFNMIAIGTAIELNEVEDLLLSAAQDDLLQGRLDLIDKTFTKRQVDPVTLTCNAAHSLSQAHRNAVQSAIIQTRFGSSTQANLSLLSQMALKQDID